MTPRELSWQELKYFCTAGDVKKFAKAASNSKGDIIGQDRAAKALHFGLQMKKSGYHIYVCGQTGTGRTTFAREFAAKKAAKEPTPPDLCYVYNFENPKCPKLLRLPAGTGRKLRDELNDLMGRLATELPKTFQGREHEQRKNDIIRVLANKRDEIIKDMTEEAHKQNFGVKNTNSGIYFMPIVDGEVISEEQFDSLTDAQREGISANSEAIQKRAAEVMRTIKDHEKNTKKDVDELEYAMGLFTVGRYMNDIIEHFAHEPSLLEYLHAVKEDILENLEEFISEDSEEETDAMAALVPWYNKKSSEDILTKYKVNLLTDNTDQKGAPVIVDYNPAYTHLVGEVEYDNEFGNFSTDFMKIKPGLLHRANGGYLILQAQDIFGSPHAWEALRRALVTKQIITEPLREYNTGVAVSGIKPEAIPLDIKVIIIGGDYYYRVLFAYDDYFEKLFKIRVDFDYEMRINDANRAELVRFIQKGAKIPFTDEAIAVIIEFATRLAERQDRLTTKFSRLNDLLSEATALAQADKAKKVAAKHVRAAIKQWEYRNNLYEEKLMERMEEDTIMISTTGAKVGQINGLAVLDTGDYAFATPSRITATAYMGKSGIVNIEKEANLSGEIHDKGVQVLIGYLGQTYAQDFALSLSCRICFEQNYGGVDGDSASSTELYVILSALSNIPIRQDIAVTGSINQHGEIQPIGGATYKIEGFYDLCKARGLTGTQGVIIPARNVRDLVLKDEVVQAVKDGKFHIYPITHVNEGIEILLNTPAGGAVLSPDNAKTLANLYPHDTVHGKVYRKLRAYHRRLSKGE
ncbi:MAG: AAA family ATPase [Defluviitaleaceae bacterium]|nr:AAA family ATPase [Defluviitaleaceae bacterium]MCL2273602.1 AAA family ATPase [Defluviitaleaceae bacterium]